MLAGKSAGVASRRWPAAGRPARAAFPAPLRRTRAPFAPTRCFTDEPAAPPAAIAHLTSIDLSDAPTTPATAAATPSARTFDYVVVGSGIAGLTYALRVAEHGRVAVITKEALSDGCTMYAQGGVCAVLDPLDSVASHVHDTMVAGNLLNDERAVDAVCREGAARVLELVDLGARFTRDLSGALHLTREGGHAARRIVHAADATGAEIARALATATRAHPRISLFEHHTCVDLVVDEGAAAGGRGAPRCLGVDALNAASGEMVRFVAGATMLASGGAGQLYPHTTNPAVATGDGIAMAWRANARVANMEFVQFHPTGLAAPAAAAAPAGRCFLISEAVRGEGGVLTNVAGERFMRDYDARLELAPRDVVARAIHDQIRMHGASHVLLDISHKPAAETLAHFPGIAARCAELGIDVTRAPIPVAPAQHYLCGGVDAGLHGETSLQGLFACGEVAHSGLHGANRLASNSLLEGLVFGTRAVGPSVVHAERMRRGRPRQLARAAAGAVFARERAPRAPSGAIAAWISSSTADVRETMWQAAGIVRTDDGLAAGASRIAALEGDVAALHATYGVSRELVELRNLVTCAQLVLQSALRRRESRGLHYNADVPDSRGDHLRATELQLRPAAPPALPAVTTVRRRVQQAAPRLHGVETRVRVPVSAR